MIEKNRIQILNPHWKLHWKMVPIAFEKFFGAVKNASQTILRTFFYAVLNSKHIFSNKVFSKMLLKAWKSLKWPLNRSRGHFTSYNSSRYIFLCSDAAGHTMKFLMTSRNFYPILMTSHNFAVSNILENLPSPQAYIWWTVYSYRLFWFSELWQYWNNGTTMYLCS